MNIKNSIKNFWSSIQDKKTQIIFTIGSKLELKKQLRIEKKINKAIESFNFTIKPTEHLDTLVILKGQLYRVQFNLEGFVVRDDVTDEAITDRLLTLKIMERIKE